MRTYSFCARQCTFFKRTACFSAPETCIFYGGGICIIKRGTFFRCANETYVFKISVFSAGSKCRAPVFFRRVARNVRHFHRIIKFFPCILNRKTVNFLKAAEIRKRLKIDALVPETRVFFHSVPLLKKSAECSAKIIA